MSGVSPYVVIAYLVIAVGATGWHMISEHYVHLVWMRKAGQPRAHARETSTTEGSGS